jgi:hypothetical protein
MWDELGARQTAAPQAVGRPFLAAVAIVVLGIGLGTIVVNPPRDTILTGFYSRTPSEPVVALRGPVLMPRAGFASLFPPFIPWAIGHVLLYLAVFGTVPVLPLGPLLGCAEEPDGDIPGMTGRWLLNAGCYGALLVLSWPAYIRTARYGWTSTPR